MRIILFNRVVSYNKATGKGLKDIFNILSSRINALAISYQIDNKTTDEKIQELKEQVYLFISKYNEKRGAFSTYIFTCLRNYIRDEIRHNVVVQKGRDISTDRIINNEERSSTEKILEENLNDFELNVVYDYSIGGYSIKDIKNKYYRDININKVKATIKTILRKLRKLIRKQRKKNIKIV